MDQMLWTMVTATIVTITMLDPQGASTNFHQTPPIDPVMIARVFEETHQGWSVDEVLLDDERRQQFLTAVKNELPKENQDAYDPRVLFDSLIKLRKSGKLKVETTRKNSIELEPYLPAAEIAARGMQDRHAVHFDQILVDPKLLEEFDQHSLRIAPDASTYALRKAALRLRKSRRLKPELTLRVTDWKRQIEERSLAETKLDVDELSTRPGIYIFRDETGYLYIGQSQNLRQRLTKHLDDSDRKGLTRYLTENSNGNIVVELHIFNEGSPAEKLAVREAYESELIRSRHPKLNLAP